MPTGEERVGTAQRIISEAQPLPFALECYRWLRSGDDVPDEDRLFSSDEEEELGGLVAGRVREVAFEEPLYNQFPENSPFLLWLWSRYGDPGEVREYLTTRFEESSDDIIRFLGSYVGTSWGLESGLPSRGDFERDAYNRVVELVDTDHLLAQLIERFGPELEQAEFNTTYDLPFESQVVHQFAAIHRHVKEEEQASAEAPQEED